MYADGKIDMVCVEKNSHLKSSNIVAGQVKRYRTAPEVK
jgi:hypothetical protein